VSNPTRAGFYDTSIMAVGIAVFGNYAYITDMITSSLQIIDVSNVSNPMSAGYYLTNDIAFGVAVSGNYAYVADRGYGLKIINVSNVISPTLAGSYDTPGQAYDVAVSGNYAYVAGSTSGLKIIDLVPCPTNSSFSTSSNNPTTTTIFSSTTNPISENSTDSTNPVTSSTNNPDISITNNPSTPFATEYSTTKSTIIEASRTSVSNGPPLLWLGLLGGGVLCVCLIGGTAFILKRRRKSSDNATSFIEAGSETLSSFELEPVVERDHKKIGGAYYQLSIIREEEAREIYRQTGHLIVFPDDKKKLKYVLGRGNFGAIKVAQRIEDRAYVASKRVKGEANMRASAAEAQMQQKAAGENILPIYNTLQLEKALYHFMPLAGLGDGSAIQEQLSTLKDSHLATEILKCVAKDLLTGLKSLHGRGYYHLDIKPDNLVFTQDGTGNITDFGCAKESTTPQISSDAIGDNRYFPPDRLQACRDETTFDGEKADLWAAGITLLQIMKNLDPFQLFEMPRQFELRVKRCGPDFFEEKLQRFEELQKAEEGTIWWVIKELLDPSLTTRITAQKALEAPCFKGLNKAIQARMFEDLKREQVAQSIQVKKEEVNLSNYDNIAQVAMRREIYDSAQHQQFYSDGKASHRKRLGHDQDYLFTPDNPKGIEAPDVATLESRYQKTPDFVTNEIVYQKTPDIVTNKIGKREGDL
ncbi:MAG: hypothetical protein K940chlam7_02019, partial [Chlamydiae bacterium]|nr:hypothetical protein [Chlamydiota bacterium]